MTHVLSSLKHQVCRQDYVEGDGGDVSCGRWQIGGCGVAKSQGKWKSMNLQLSLASPTVC